MMEMKMKKMVFALLMLASPALAQVGTPVTTNPAAVLSNNGSGTITATNVFQSVYAATSVAAPRKGCLVMNTSTDRQWVYFGPIASATKATAIPLEPASATNAAGGSLNCATAAGGALQDQISITGTISDTFVAMQQ
jgi:hypothetical protein